MLTRFLNAFTSGFSFLFILYMSNEEAMMLGVRMSRMKIRPYMGLEFGRADRVSVDTTRFCKIFWKGSEYVLSLV